jgi:uncharacterized membrane protein
MILNRRLHATVLAAAVLAVIATLATAAQAAAATVTRETFVMPFAEPGVDDCRIGVTGTVTGTDVIDVQSVETANGFHLKGTSSGTGRIDWNDGTYALLSWKTEFTFQAPREDATAYQEAHVDYLDTYAADGTLLFHEAFRVVERFAVTNGAVSQDFHKTNVHFHPDC